MNRNIVLLLKQLNLFLEQYRREQMKNLDISPSQSLVLDYLLSRKGRTVYATELHEKFGISKAAISATLKSLRQKGYVKMVVNPKDDRKKQIILMSKAYKIEQYIDASLMEQQAYLCREIPKQHLEILESGLNTMIRNMKREPIRRNET